MIKNVYVINEKPLESFLKDFYTFGGIFALAWLNYKYLDSSIIIDMFAVFVIIVVLFSIPRKTGLSDAWEKMTHDEAVEYFTKQKLDSHEKTTKSDQDD